MAGILEKFKARREGRETASDDKRIFFQLNEKPFSAEFVQGEEIGRGAFAVVYKCKRKSDNTEWAVKVIEKNNIDTKIESLKIEVKILMNIKHPNVLCLSDVFEDDERVFLVMELMRGGELFDKICNDHPQGYSEAQAAAIIKHILLAVQYLHSKGIIHRDLKPENLLFAETNDEAASIKITDFGLAKIWSGDMFVKTACGSPNYVAPEVLLNEMHGYGVAVDIWSVGVISYVLLCGFCPFYDENTPALFRAIAVGHYSFPSPYWDHVSQEARDFIRRLLVVNPEKRYTAEQALNHPWIAENKHQVPMPSISNYMKVFKEVRKPNAGSGD